jgi:hypothetical protein
MDDEGLAKLSTKYLILVNSYGPVQSAGSATTYATVFDLLAQQLLRFSCLYPIAGRLLTGSAVQHCL